MKKTSKPIVRFFRTILIGGILFLFPVSALILVLAKPVALARKVVEPIGDKLPFESIVGLETPLLLALIGGWTSVSSIPENSAHLNFLLGLLLRDSPKLRTKRKRWVR
jgi:hypothetical protein